MTDADKIFEAIRQDPDNADFTAQGWDPLYHIEPEATILIASQAPGRKAQTTKTYWNDQVVTACELGWASPRISFITAVKLQFCR